MNKKDWRTVKAFGWGFACLERDKYKCVKCGSVKNIVVHHIDGSRRLGVKNMNNELSNLQTLCRKCHAVAHNQSGKNTEEIIEMANMGMNYGDIGKKFGISKQRVEQIFKKNGGITNCPHSEPYIPKKKKPMPPLSP